MKRVLGCMLLCISMLACASKDTNTMDVKDTAPNFEVVLAGNPTTGFQWTVADYDTKLLTLSESKFEPAHTKRVGAGGQMHFTFSLNKGRSYPASTEIVFKYARVWEPKTATKKWVKVNFVK